METPTQTSIQYYNSDFKNFTDEELIKLFNVYKNSGHFDPTGCCLLVGEICSRHIKI